MARAGNDPDREGSVDPRKPGEADITQAESAMPFILAEQRDRDCDKAFADYRAYLTSEAGRFPKSAYSLATSDWYFSFSHQSPHDARLIKCAVEEEGNFDHGFPWIRVRLLGAFGDGFIEFEYPEVYNFELSYKGGLYGHQDWRYDEFRVSETGRLIHEIEWRGAIETGHWLIESSDVTYQWIPMTNPPNSGILP
jgi:hypothetical protein